MRALRAAQASFLLFIFSLIFMQPSLAIGGTRTILADLLFLLTFAFWLLALLRGERGLRWHGFFWLLLLYFAALSLSAFSSPDPRTSMIKLAGEAYLLNLPILAFNLVESEGDLRRAMTVWLAATILLAPIALCSLLLFYWQPDHRLLDFTLFGFGSLPEGPYPRLRLTFEKANMLCHYLSIGMMMVLIARHAGWIGGGLCRLLLGAILLMAPFTISPGLGGIGLCLGLWAWLLLRKEGPVRARLALAAGGGIALAFVAAAMVAPEVHPTAPFLIDLPLGEGKIAPSGRIMTWMGALHTFLAHPVFGSGLGTGATSVSYLPPVGGMQHLTDAHNLLLNVAAESGLPALIALLAIAFWLLRAMIPLSLDGSRASMLRTGLGIAFIGAFFYQGLAGSFEDARHLWVLIGLFLVACRPDLRTDGEVISR